MWPQIPFCNGMTPIANNPVHLARGQPPTRHFLSTDYDSCVKIAAISALQHGFWVARGAAMVWRWNG